MAINNGSKPSSEALGFHSTRAAQQSMSGFRKLTALELLGRSPVPISISEFDGAVFYFSHPSARQVMTFFQSRDRIIKEIQGIHAKMTTALVQQATEAAEEQDMMTATATAKTAVSSSTSDFLGDPDAGGLTNEIHKLTCDLLTVVLVDESGAPMFTGDQIANEMSKDNFLIFSVEMFKFLVGTSKAKSVDTESEDEPKSDEEVKADLITLEDELDSKPVDAAEVEEPKNA
jgi:hypothetical protein